jgi:hypothetical protein
MTQRPTGQRKYSYNILDLRTGWTCTVSLTPLRFTPIKRMDRLHSRSERYGGQKNLFPLPGIKPR